ncbi:esterase [Aureimonas endophytica]|uniref:Esterase n=1 Tax=Aureimonas endophytica TaxID=2027858 RepID=A0A916ZNJ1_9HYPH|nr:PHB depolymerase family esterase [Aureimonas endophytica]GGE06286.1 esterase [Aureimonas endophytica]
MVRPLPFMVEAQRLVLSQRLSDATDLIQQGLGLRSPSLTSPPDAFSGVTIELSADGAELAGDVASGEARCMPRSRPRFAAEASIRPTWSTKPAPTIPQGAEFLYLVHAGPAGRRAYRLYVPAAEARGPRPLVVMLHGCTQNPEDFATGTRMNEIAEEANVLVAYPEQDRSANPHLCWNWFEPTHQNGDAGEPAILAGIVEDIARSHAVDRSRLFAAGLSAGGAMAAILGSTRPDLFAAVGIHSGLPHASARDVATALAVMRSGKALGQGVVPSVPAIVFHGVRDTTVHPANGDRIAGLDTERQDRAETVTGTVNGRAFTRIRRPAQGSNPAMEHWRVEGLGHAWSGGDAAGSYADPAGPDASREMLRFFLNEAGARE